MPSANRAMTSPTTTTKAVPMTTHVKLLNSVSRVSLPEKISL